MAPYTQWWLGTTVDLHQAIGLSMVVIAALGTRSRPGLAWLGIAGAVVLVAPLLRGITFGTPVLDAPLDALHRVGPQRLLRGHPVAVLPAGGRDLRVR